MCLFILIEIICFWRPPKGTYCNHFPTFLHHLRQGSHARPHFGRRCLAANDPSAGECLARHATDARSLWPHAGNPFTLLHLCRVTQCRVFLPRFHVLLFFYFVPLSPIFFPRDSNTCTYPIKQFEGMMRYVQASDTGDNRNTNRHDTRSK